MVKYSATEPYSRLSLLSPLSFFSLVFPATFDRKDLVKQIIDSNSHENFQGQKIRHIWMQLFVTVGQMDTAQDLLALGLTVAVLEQPSEASRDGATRID